MKVYILENFRTLVIPIRTEGNGELKIGNDDNEL